MVRDKLSRLERHDEHWSLYLADLQWGPGICAKFYLKTHYTTEHGRSSIATCYATLVSLDATVFISYSAQQYTTL